MIITLSGFPASGTTIVAKNLAESTGFYHVNAGAIVREYAIEKGWDIGEINEMLAKNRHIEEELHDRLLKKVRSESGDIIFESAYTGRDIPDVDLRVWLKAPEVDRIDRYAEREELSRDEASREIYQIQRCIRDRAKKFHNIDIDDLSTYDIVLDTTNWSGVEAISEIIIKSLELLPESQSAPHYRVTRTRD